MEGGTELLIRHLPSQLSLAKLQEFVKYFGAERVRTLGSRGRWRNAALATFSSPSEAQKALLRLHQLEVLGRRLVVEIAVGRRDYRALGDESEDIAAQSEEPKKEGAEACAQKEWEEKKHLVGTAAAKFGFEYPANPRLRYQYPPPTPAVVENITRALLGAPKFYVQVLHLMNKMNLPCPFFPVFPPPPPKAAPPPASEAVTTTGVEDVDEGRAVSSSEESELESDEESRPTVQPRAPQVLKRPGLAHPQPPRKRLRVLDMITLPAGHPSEGKERVAVQASQVFEAGASLADRHHIAIRLGGAAEQQYEEEDVHKLLEAQPIVERGGFGLMEAAVAAKPAEEQAEASENSSGSESEGEQEFISSRRLRRNRLSDRERRDLSLFRRYDPGDPTSRLYVKNLAKQVTDKDLRYIYGRYVDWSSEQQKNMFDVRLMKTGRMKDQAFITLPTDRAARRAREETNAYTLHGKPIIVVFARSAKGKEDQKSLLKADDKTSSGRT